MRKQIGAVAMTLALAAAGLFSGFYSQNIYAADTQTSDTSTAVVETTVDDSDIINDSDTVFNEIGIDTSEVPDGYDEDSEENPNGAEYKSLSSIGEVLNVYAGGSVLYGNDNTLDDNYQTFLDTKNTYDDITTETGAYRAAASGCFDGKGRKSDIAIATLSSGGALTLSVTGKQNDFKAMSSPIPVKTLSDIDSSYSRQNLLEITTGDFNCDGLDEIALIMPQTSATSGNAQVVVYKMKGTSLSPYVSSNWTMVWSYTLPKSATYWNNYDLCICDVNGDAADDLIVSWGKTTLASGASNSNAKLTSEGTSESSSVLLLGGKTRMLQNSSEISYGNDKLCRVAFTTGDVNGDGSDEIIMGGQVLSEALSDNTTRCLAVYNYDSDKKNLSTSSIVNKKVVDQGNGYDEQYLSMPDMKANLAVASVYGADKDTCVYLDSVLYTYSNGAFEIADELDDGETVNKTNLKISHPFHGDKTYSEYNANGSKFTGSSNGGILVERINAGKFKSSDLVYAKYSKGMNEDQKEDLSMLRKDLGGNGSGTVNGAFATLTDTDKDSAVMKYTGNHYLAYTDPKILAVMASSPYFKDVVENTDGGEDMLGSCETSFGNSSGTGSISGDEKDVSVGGAFESSTAVTLYYGTGYSYSGTHTTTKSTEFNITYTSLAGTDCVALYSVPVAVYQYEIEYTDTDGELKTKYENIEIPYQPVTQTINLETYDKVQENYKDRLPVVSGEIISSTPGDPSSYPSSSKGYENAIVYDGSWAGTAYASEGSISQEISSSTEKDNEYSEGAYIYFSLLLHLIPDDVFNFGGNLEITTSNITGDVTSKGTTASGTVANMPKEAEQYGYYFAWKLMTYSYKTASGDSFPVVTYLTKDVTTPPALPEDFSQDDENTTDTQIGLSWTYSDSVSTFDIFRKSKFSDGDSYIKVGTVTSSDYSLKKDANGEIVYDENGKTVKEYSFIEKNLSPYTDYEYSIQVNRNKIPPQSIQSETLKTRTRAKYQPEVKISDEELALYPDSVKTVTATAQDSSEFTYKNKSYQWQKYDEKKDSWNDIAGKTSAQYKFVNCSMDDEGDYRCRLNTEISVGDSVLNITAYTDTLHVTFSKRDVKFGQVSYTETGSSTTFTIDITNSGDGTKSQPSGMILFTLSDGQNETQKMTSIDVSKNTAKVTFTNLESGSYELSTEYIGQSSIFRDRKNDDTFVYMKDITAGSWISSKKTYAYHENIMDSLKLYSLKEGSNGQAVKTDITDQITKIEICASGYEDACASFTLNKDNEIAFIPAGDTSVSDAMKEIVSDHQAIIKISYNDGENSKVITRTVKTEKADITLYLDDMEANSADTLKNISLNDVKVKGGGYKEGSCPFTLKNNNMTGVQDLFDSEINSAHFNIGLYTTTGSLIGNLFESTQSGENQIDVSDILAGKYSMKVRCADNYDKWDQLSNYYNITLDTSSFVLYGDTYTIDVEAAYDNGKQVGSVSLVSPDKTDEVTGMKYQGGTSLTLKAVPVSNYYIKCWEVCESGETRTIVASSNKLSYTVQGSDKHITIKAVFALTENHFSYRAIGGGHVECTNATLDEDSIVISGRELNFKAEADSGYEFLEWRKVTVGQSTEISKGNLSEDGTSSSNTFTMGNASTVLYAVFQRQKADIELSDNLIAYYLNSSDIDSSAADGLELKVNNDNKVAKGATVIIRPEAGYKVSNWNVTGIDEDDIEKIEGDTAIKFVVPDDVDKITVNADATAGVYAISIEGTDGMGNMGSAPAKYDISLNGNTIKEDVEDPATVDDLDRVTAGTTLEVKAKPNRGYIFDHWKVNNKDIAGSSLTYSTNVTKNLNIIAVCKKLTSFDVTTSIAKVGDTERITGIVYNSYGEEEYRFELSSADNKISQKVALFQDDYINYVISNGNINYVKVNDMKVTNLTTSYQLTDITPDSNVYFYFMPSIYHKVNIENNTDYTLRGTDETSIKDAVYVGSEEEYTIYIDKAKDNADDVYAYLDGNEISITDAKIELKNITKESTLVLTKNKNYRISNEDELIEYLNALKVNPSVNAVLENDIELTSDWSDTQDESGNYNSIFKDTVLSGTFDGNGHTIKGRDITTIYGGFFQNITETAIVKNVRFSAFNINRITSDEHKYMGIISESNSGTIENCIVENCKIVPNNSNTLATATVIAINKGTIQNCLINDCYLKGNYGFISYDNSGEIKNCYVRHIKSQGYISGIITNDCIVGNYKASGSIANCYYDQGYLSSSKQEFGFGTSIWTSETERSSAGRIAWKLNNTDPDNPNVWGISATDAEYPVLLNMEYGDDIKVEKPVVVTYINYNGSNDKVDYIYPGALTLPSKEESGVDAWTDGTTCYGAGSKIDSVTKNVSFTKADIEKEYIIAVDVKDNSGESVEYFKSLDDALTYTDANAGNANTTVSISINGDTSLSKAGRIFKDVSVTLNNATVIIRDGASLTNGGILTVSAGSKMTNYGTFSNSAGATLEISTSDSATGSFLNIGAFSNSGTILGQNLISCKPHQYSEKKITKQPTSDEEGIMTQICAVCLAEKTTSIPKNAVNPDSSQIARIVITDPTDTNYFVEDTEDGVAPTIDDDEFDATGIDAVAYLKDGSTATITGLKYSINGYEIEDDENLDKFFDENNICNTDGFVLTIEAPSEYENITGAEKTCELTITGDGVGHQLELVKAVEATATSDGNIAYYVCEDRCGKYFSATDSKVEITKDDIIIKKETVIEKEKADAAVKAAEEEKKVIQDLAAKYGISQDTLTVDESTLTNRKNDADVKGSTFGKLTLKAGKVSRNSIRITWKKAAGADGYMIFGNLCGNKYQLKKLKTVSATSTSYINTKLKAGKYYKYCVIAYKLVNGKKVTIAVSRTIHEATSGGKYGRITGITVKKVGSSKSKKITLKANNTAKITATEKHSRKIARHRKLSYESSNTNVAKVSSTGRITAVKKGKCSIYIYAQNGTYTTVTVTVK